MCLRYTHTRMPGDHSQRKRVPFRSFECFGKRFIVRFVVLMWWWLLFVIAVAVAVAVVGLRRRVHENILTMMKSTTETRSDFFFGSVLRHYFICIPKCMYWMCFLVFVIRKWAFLILYVCECERVFPFLWLLFILAALAEYAAIQILRCISFNTVLIRLKIFGTTIRLFE